MFRSAADRRAANRNRRIARVHLCNETFTERYGLDRCNFRKFNVGFYKDGDREDNRSKLRLEHAAYDLDALHHDRQDEAAEWQERAEREYREACSYLDDHPDRYDWSDELPPDGEDEAWSIYHEFLSVEAHNSNLRERFEPWECEFPAEYHEREESEYSERLGNPMLVYGDPYELMKVARQAREELEAA